MRFLKVLDNFLVLLDMYICLVDTGYPTQYLDHDHGKKYNET